MVGGSPPVDQAAQHREQLWNAMDFVDDDQPASKGFEQGLRIGETGKVGGPLQIEVNRPWPTGR